MLRPTSTIGAKHRLSAGSMCGYVTLGLSLVATAVVVPVVADTTPPAKTTVSVPTPLHSLLRIAFLGDSITRGNAIHEVNRRGPLHVQGRGNFPLRIQAMANCWNVSNFGHGGTTVQRACDSTAGAYVDTDTFNVAMKWGADVYVMMLGTNDVISCWNAGAFATDLLAVALQVIQYASLGMYILIPPPLVHKDTVKDGLMRRELVPAVLDVVERLQFECEKKYVRMIDIAGECLDPRARNCFGDDAFLHDGVHLNTVGAERVAETVFRFLQASPSGVPTHECA